MYSAGGCEFRKKRQKTEDKKEEEGHCSHFLLFIYHVKLFR